MMILIILAVISADQVTKALAEAGGKTSLNPGISFGWLGAWPAPLLSLGLLTLIIGSWIIYKHIWQRIPVAAGLFLGGAVSNIIDRLYWSGVRDWLPIPGTAIHNNLADYAIGVGLLLMIGHYFIQGEGRSELAASISSTKNASSEPDGQEED
jgi:lipoprotein signal peptidase